MNFDKPKNKDIILNIYDKIFSNINENHIDIFLCGGASNKKSMSIRDSVRLRLDGKRNTRILYPEDLFIELLNKHKNYNLLSLEKFLADNCDVICIICESPGSLVELGAFTNNEKTFGKVVAAIEKQREKDKSFIILGPVRLIQKDNNENVLFYKNVDDLNEKLKWLINKKRVNKVRLNKGKSTRGINTIVGQYYFILIVIYFYSILNVKKLTLYISFIFKQKGMEQNDFNILFRSALKMLYKERLIQKSMSNNEAYYSLTPKGYEKINILFHNFDTKLKDSIRFAIMKNEFY